MKTIIVPFPLPQIRDYSSAASTDRYGPEVKSLNESPTMLRKHHIQKKTFLSGLAHKSVFCPIIVPRIGIF